MTGRSDSRVHEVVSPIQGFESFYIVSSCSTSSSTKAKTSSTSSSSSSSSSPSFSDLAQLYVSILVGDATDCDHRHHHHHHHLEIHQHDESTGKCIKKGRRTHMLHILTRRASHSFRSFSVRANSTVEKVIRQVGGRWGKVVTTRRKDEGL